MLPNPGYVALLQGLLPAELALTACCGAAAGRRASPVAPPSELPAHGGASHACRLEL